MVKLTDFVCEVNLSLVSSIFMFKSFMSPSITASLVDLFVMPASEGELRERLANRATDSIEVIETRLHNAMEEMTQAHSYTYQLISGSREDDYRRFRALLAAERMRVSRLT